MASLSTCKKNGCKTIQFVDKNKKIRTLRLGKMQKPVALNVKLHIERLNFAQITATSLPNDTAVWLNEIGSELRTKIAKLGLIAQRESVELGAFIDSYITARKQLKLNTIKSLTQARKLLTNYFGENRIMKEMTLQDADKFHEHLMNEKYSDATISKQIKKSREFWKRAIRYKLVDDNIFADIKTHGETNESRQHYIDRETLNKLLDESPNSEFRLILILCRIFAFRCTSEVMTFKFSDIDWAGNKITIDAPKTGRRTLPIFPEGRPYLEHAFNNAPPGTNYVIYQNRLSNQKLRTRFQQVIRQCGLSQWERLFHNLRLSRITEMARQNIPIKSISTWCGVGTRIIADHYLKALDEDLITATQKPTGAPILFTATPEREFIY